VKLATLPALKGNKNALVDNQTIYFAPEHVMELDNPKEDLEEFKLSDNIRGILETMSVLTNKAQQCVAIYPTTMGALPEMSSTTATAVAGAESRTNTRGNYKSLTFEYTFLLEFYWMILQMTYSFAEEETANLLMGDMAQFFDPNADYTYSPLSSNIEMEYNKNKKVQLYDQILGRLMGMVQAVPQLIPVISHVISRMLELQGDEYQTISGMIKQLSQAKPVPEGGEGGGGGGTETPSNVNFPMSNQEGIEMSQPEQSVRGIPTRGF
jgi:hypothetical protein